MSDREFRDITADVDALLEDPKHAPAVATARAALAEADREYAMGLSALRQALGLTQVELAKRLDVTQGNVAQIEKRGDLLVSTLASYLHAVGGEVRIVVQFPGGHAIEVELDALTDTNQHNELAASS
jgi:DNA-binding XRE family transcriptional regulator